MTKKSSKKAAAKTAVKQVASVALVGKAPASTAAVPSKKASAKTDAKKMAAKSSAKTQVVAKVDIGWGNSLYVRGSGGGLSWDKGLVLKNNGADEWSIALSAAKGKIELKFLINDECWAAGENHVVTAGDKLVTTPHF